MAAIAGYGGALLECSTPSVVPTFPVAMTDSGDHTTYFITNQAQRYWDNTAPPVVQTSPDGSTWTTQVSTLYTVQYVGGKIIWNTPQASNIQTRILSGIKYFPWIALVDISSWTFDSQVTTDDVSFMLGDGSGGLQAGAGFKTFLPTLTEGTFTVNKWWVPENTLTGGVAYYGFSTSLTNETQLIVSGSSNGQRFEGYAYLKKESIKVDVQKPVEESLDLQVSGQFYRD